MAAKRNIKLTFAALVTGIFLFVSSCAQTPGTQTTSGSSSQPSASQPSSQSPSTSTATGNTVTAANQGTLEIRVTDPPPADVVSAVVHLTNIEVHQVTGNTISADNSSSSNDTGGWISVLNAPDSFDLMDVVGVEQVLGSANLTAGSFTEIRMDVTSVTGVTADNVSYSATVPSDKLKVVGAFNVGGGSKTTLTLDFDGQQSLISTGQGKYLFKPVVKLLVDSGGKVKNGNLSQSGQSSQSNQPNQSNNASQSKGNGGNSANATGK